MKLLVSAEEWDFSNVPINEVNHAWRWEVARELEKEDPALIWEAVHPELLTNLVQLAGSPLRPYASLSAKAKDYLFRRLGDDLELGLKEIDEETARKQEDDRFFNEMGIYTHRFSINWRESKHQLKKEFSNWLDKNYRINGRSQKTNRGRKHDALSWLCDLAIYRVAKLHTRAEASAILCWIVDARRTTAFTASHFEDAQRRTKQRLEKYKRIRKGINEALVKLRADLGTKDIGTIPI